VAAYIRYLMMCVCMLNCLAVDFNFSKYKLMRSLMMVNCNTEIFRSCFNVNFNIVF